MTNLVFPYYHLQMTWEIRGERDGKKNLKDDINLQLNAE